MEAHHYYVEILLWDVLQRDLLDGHEVAILQVKSLVHSAVRSLPYLISKHVFVVERLGFVELRIVLPRRHLVASSVARAWAPAAAAGAGGSAVTGGGAESLASSRRGPFSLL